jgi:hypothetical protein
MIFICSLHKVYKSPRNREDVHLSDRTCFNAENTRHNSTKFGTGKFTLRCQGNLISVRNCMVIEGKRPLGRPRRRWEDNIKMDLKLVGIDGANWIQLTQDRVQWRACVNPVMKLRVP